MTDNSYTNLAKDKHTLRRKYLLRDKYRRKVFNNDYHCPCALCTRSRKNTNHITTPVTAWLYDPHIARSKVWYGQPLRNSKKAKRQDDSKGSMKGKVIITTSPNLLFFAKKDCKTIDYPLFQTYKNNSYKNPFDESKPVCVVCYSNNSGAGRRIFKTCIHGNQLCYSCAKRCDRCPICRSPK